MQSSVPCRPTYVAFYLYYVVCYLLGPGAVAVYRAHRTMEIEDDEHVVGHPQEGTQPPFQRARALALSEEVLQDLPPDAPVLADLQARQVPLAAPAPHRGLLDSHQLGYVLRAQQPLLNR
jgi:hypothetical protein